MGGPSAEHSRCRHEGRDVPATDVDHIVPVTGPDDPRFWAPANHQSLCHDCHSAKTARGDRPLNRATPAASPVRRTNSGIVLL